MKHKYFILTVVMFIAGSLFVGCNDTREEDAAQSVEQANEDFNNDKIQFENEWDDFKSNVETAINKNEQRIEELKEEMKNSSNDFKDKYENKILTLEQKNIELRKKLNEYKYEGKDSWEEFKQGFSDEMDSLENSINDIFDGK